MRVFEIIFPFEMLISNSSEKPEQNKAEKKKGTRALLSSKGLCQALRKCWKRVFCCFSGESEEGRMAVGNEAESNSRPQELDLIPQRNIHFDQILRPRTGTVQARSSREEMNMIDSTKHLLVRSQSFPSLPLGLPEINGNPQNGIQSDGNGPEYPSEPQPNPEQLGIPNEENQGEISEEEKKDGESHFETDSAQFNDLRFDFLYDLENLIREVSWLRAFRPETPKIKRLIEVESTVDPAKLVFVEERQSPDTQKGFQYLCPICFRYFDRILETSCCGNYLCHFCVSDMNETTRKSTCQDQCKCPFCASENTIAKDIDALKPIRLYMDTPQDFGSRSKEKKQDNQVSPMKVAGINEKEDNIEGNSGPLGSLDSEKEESLKGNDSQKQELEENQQLNENQEAMHFRTIKQNEDSGSPSEKN